MVRQAQSRAPNQGSRPLWVFLRMPSMRDDSLADTNALVTGVKGHLVVVKATPTRRIEERAFGVVALDPGAEARGDVPIGRRLAGHTDRLALATDRAIGVVHDVALIVGFAEQRPGDAPINTSGGPAFLRFDPARQQLVRTAPVPW